MRYVPEAGRGLKGVPQGVEFMRAAFLAVLMALPAYAGSVYLNGVNVDGITNQTFEKVTVRIDGAGNLMIDAPGYSVKKVTSAPDAPPPVHEVGISKHYILVTEQSPLGATEYDIDVFINGKLVRSLHSGEDQIVSEVTKYLRPGKNAVMFQAKKNFANKDQPKSVSRSHVFRVIIGEGEMGTDQVMIENPVIKFERSAADMTDVVQEFTLTTK
jgi:hypothetical protein